MPSMPCRTHDARSSVQDRSRSHVEGVDEGLALNSNLTLEVNGLTNVDLQSDCHIWTGRRQH